MSDRFVLQTSKEEIEQFFEVSTERKDFFDSDFNITPGSLIPAIDNGEDERKIYSFKWGLIPPGAGEEKKGLESSEVHVEDLETDSWLKECLDERRCLIPANGFYKWKTTQKRSTPFYIRLLSNNLMAFAGIYSIWKSSNGRDVYSCAILTTVSNALVQPVDDRMPVIIRPENYGLWLSGHPLSSEDFENVTEGYSMIEMAVNRVSEEVNNPKNNSAELIQPIPK